MIDNLPNHVAIIPDGNRRWATLKGLPSIEGHRAGAERMFQVADRLNELGVKHLTVWGFSVDNWKRRDEEVQGIFNLLQLWIEKQTSWAHSRGIRLRHIGRLQELPAGLQTAMRRAVSLTYDNAGMTLNVAFNYAGRAEIVDAIRQIISACLPENLINERLVGQHLYTDGIPDVDLLIRSAGEFRISNFLLWQTAYSEYYFTPTLWPDFNEKELEKALEVYSQRQRRFGGD